MALVGDTLYLPDGPGVHLLDAESGKETACVRHETLGPVVKWLAVDRAILYLMAGGNGGQRPTGIGAYDLAAGKWLWRHNEADDSLDATLIGMYGGRVYYCVKGKAIFCREGKSGTLIWQNAAGPLAKTKQFQFGFPSVDTFICAEKTIAVNQPGRKTEIVSAIDGRPLWTLPKTETIVFYKDLLLNKRLWHSLRVYDAVSGEESLAMSQVYPGSNCGMFTVTPNLWLGQGGPTHDFKTDKPLHYCVNDTFARTVNGKGALAQ